MTANSYLGSYKNKLFTMLLTVLFSLSLTLVAPVSAHGGGESKNSTQSQSSSSQSTKQSGQQQKTQQQQTQSKNSQLPNTGSGSAVVLFILASFFGTLAFRKFLLKNINEPLP